MYKFLITFFLLIPSFVLSQIERFNYEKFDDYFEKLSVKHKINYDKFFTPISETDKEKLLNQLLTKKDKLSKFERELLDYLIKSSNFNQSESQTHLKIFSIKDKSVNLFDYHDDKFNLKANPSFELSYEDIFDRKILTRAWGFYVTGKHENGISFHITFKDHILNKPEITNQIDFLNKQGRVVTVSKTDRSEFSDTRGSLLYQNDWLLLGALKENINFGYGENSQLILSNRAPSFPSFLLRLNLTEWLTVYSLHGWLLSGIADSTKSYDTEVYKRIVEHEKYFALHSFQIKPFKSLTLNFGETIIYSDRGPYLGYMFPFLFYRSIDHLFGYGSEDSGNNGSFFFDASLSLLNKLKIYSSIFIDELSITNLLKGNKERNQLAYQFGLKTFDILSERLFTTFEYTRILPWVYSNWIPAQTYTNQKFPLGHYIFQNSDQIFLKLRYYFAPDLSLSLFADYTRNGGFSNVKDQYLSPGEAFLYGDVRKIFHAGTRIEFEYFYRTKLSVEYHFYNVTDSHQSRTPDWQKNKNHYIMLGLGFNNF